MSSVAPIKQKLAKVVAMLASPNDDERRNAWRALITIMRGANVTFVDLAQWIADEDKVASDSQAQLLSSAELQQFYDAAFAAGQASVQPDDDESFVPREPNWWRIADLVAPHVNELDIRERDFAADMIRLIRCGGQLSPKRAKWFGDICMRLGRRHGFTI
jgi:hypothetical protein